MKFASQAEARRIKAALKRRGLGPGVIGLQPKTATGARRRSSLDDTTKATQALNPSHDQGAKAMEKETPKVQWGQEKLRTLLDNKLATDPYTQRFPRLFAERSDLPSLCAADWINHLVLPTRLEGWTEEEYNAALAFTICRSAGPWAMCATNSQQRDVAKKLKELGFEALRTVFNPNSNNSVTIWMAATRSGIESL